jgi:AraC-like DNA-binding protein
MMRADSVLARTDALIARSSMLVANGRELLETAKVIHRTLGSARLTFVRRRVVFITSHRAAMPEVIGRIVDAVSANLEQRQTLADLGRLLGRSPWHLNVAFHQCTRLTIHEYSTCLRMESAVRAIREGVKIEAIASGLGYRSRKSFYRQFKSSFDVRPTEYRPPPGHRRSLDAWPAGSVTLTWFRGRVPELTRDPSLTDPA